MTDKNTSRRKHTALLGALAVGMFGFAFALVPLYNLVCEIAGVNGKTSAVAVAVDSSAKVSDREVTIQFLGHVTRGMPSEFRPMQNQLRVRLGEVHTTHFYVRNHAGQRVVGQAVPSVSPGLAARYLHKIECFCFQNQPLEGDEAKEMPVRFYVDVDLPDTVSTLTLSYTLFRIDEPSGSEATAARGSNALSVGIARL